MQIKALAPMHVAGSTIFTKQQKMHLGMSFQSNHWRQHQYVATIKMPTSNTPYNNINLASDSG
jgi:hypothetical protein